MLMNAKPQTHAKMADNARTQLEAINANASLDLQAEIAKQVGYCSETKHNNNNNNWLTSKAQILCIYIQMRHNIIITIN